MDFLWGGRGPALFAVIVVFAAGGCGSSTPTATRQSPSAAGVKVLMHEMIDALAAGRFSTVCDDLMTPGGRAELLQEAGDRFASCERQLAAASTYLGASGLVKAKRNIGRAPIVINGDTAIASPNDRENAQWFVFRAGQWYASSPTFR